MPSDSPTAADQSGAAEAPSAEAPVAAEDESASLLEELSVGTVIDGKYKVDRVLGRGAMGVVVKATHVHLGESVALKFLLNRTKSAGPEEFQSRFRREAKVSAKLKNEHITRVIDVGVYRSRLPFMVMDYLDGSDLRQTMKAVGGPLPIGTAIDFIVQVCVGIAEAHASGIVHRDLKPSNLFIVRRPDGSDLVKILDFGISKWRASESELDELTQTGVVLGSPKYMAPEQLFGSAEVDSRADVWSIGAILYELLCGRPPFDLPTFTRICAELSTNNPPPGLVARRPEITPELEAVVMKCFERDPNKRTQNVAELAGNLLDAVQAPFAEPMRQKIAAILEPSGMLGASGAKANTSGAYHPLGTSGAFSTMSTSSSSSGSMRASGTGPASTNVGHAVESSEPAKKKGSTPLAIGVVVVLLAVGGYFAFGRSGAGESSTPAPSASAAVATAPPQPTAAPAPPTASAAAAAFDAASAASASASASASTAPVATSHPVLHGGPWRPAGGGRPAPPPPATTVAAQTAAPAPPPPPPPPQPTTKVDPLGDRQ